MKKLLALMCLIAVPSVYGNVYLEPYFGAAYGSYVAEEGKGKYTTSLTGSLYGTRVGIGSDELAVGFDFSQSHYSTSLDSSPDNATASEKGVFDGKEYNQTYYGIFASYKLRSVFKYLGKAWGTYFFSAKNEGINDNSSHVVAGVAVGIAIRPIDFHDDFVDVHINLEMRALQADRHHNATEYLLTVSLPFDV